MDPQAFMSMAAGPAAAVAVANGLKRQCLIPRHAPASLRLQVERLHKFGSTDAEAQQVAAKALARHRIMGDGSNPPHSVSLFRGEP